MDGFTSSWFVAVAFGGILMALQLLIPRAKHAALARWVFAASAILMLIGLTLLGKDVYKDPGDSQKAIFLLVTLLIWAFFVFAGVRYWREFSAFDRQRKEYEDRKHNLSEANVRLLRELDESVGFARTLEKEIYALKHPAQSILIHSALWGIGGTNYVERKEQLGGYLASKTPDVRASIQFLGHEYKNEPKHLVVRFSCQGSVEIKTKTFVENELITFERLCG